MNIVSTRFVNTIFREVVIIFLLLTMMHIMAGSKSDLLLGDRGNLMQ